MLTLSFVAGPVAAEEVVLAFGDSLTAGYGLQAQAGLVPQLEGWLRADGQDVRLINGGNSGDTTAMALARLGWSLGDAPDLVIVTLGGNDVLRGVPPEETRANLAAIIEQVQATGADMLLVGMLASQNYGEGYKAAFDAIYPDLAARYDIPLFPYFFSPVTRGLTLAEARAAYFQPDGLHPNAEGVKVIVAALGPVVADLLTAP